VSDNGENLNAKWRHFFWWKMYIVHFAVFYLHCYKSRRQTT